MLLILLACETETVDHGPDLAGTITAESGEAAEVTVAKAFGIANGDSARVLVSPNPDATCADAADFYGTDPKYNAEVVSRAGACVVDIRVDVYDGAAANYDGSTDALLSFNCAMDEGEWVYESRTGSKAWFYDGPFWQGSPAGLTEYTLDVGAATEGEPLEVTLGVSSYDGRFIYDNDEPEADPATGEVAGYVAAEWCADLDVAL